MYVFCEHYVGFLLIPCSFSDGIMLVFWHYRVCFLLIFCRCSANIRCVFCDHVSGVLIIFCGFSVNILLLCLNMLYVVVNYSVCVLRTLCWFSIDTLFVFWWYSVGFL